jgi:hypothetical protein
MIRLKLNQYPSNHKSVEDTLVIRLVFVTCHLFFRNFEDNADKADGIRKEEWVVNKRFFTCSSP